LELFTKVVNFKYKQNGQLSGVIVGLRTNLPGVLEVSLKADFNIVNFWMLMGEFALIFSGYIILTIFIAVACVTYHRRN